MLVIGITSGLITSSWASWVGWHVPPPTAILNQDGNLQTADAHAYDPLNFLQLFCPSYRLGFTRGTQ